MTWYTPPEIAKQLRVDVAKIIARIRAGELVAIDVSTPGSRRPRYRISDEALQDFILRRKYGPR